MFEYPGPEPYLTQNKPAQRSIVAAIEISKAFDTVPIRILVSKILANDLHPNYKMWLSNLVTGRQAHVKYDISKSKTRLMKNGVPQGVVISHTIQPVPPRSANPPTTRRIDRIIRRRPHNSRIRSKHHHRGQQSTILSTSPRKLANHKQNVSICSEILNHGNYSIQQRVQ